jgi:DNA-binding LacI/PurR family transcriptional regulator
MTTTLKQLIEDLDLAKQAHPELLENKLLITTSDSRLLLTFMLDDGTANIVVLDGEPNTMNAEEVKNKPHKVVTIDTEATIKAIVDAICSSIDDDEVTALYKEIVEGVTKRVFANEELNDDNTLEISLKAFVDVLKAKDLTDDEEVEKLKEYMANVASASMKEANDIKENFIKNLVNNAIEEQK